MNLPPPISAVNLNNELAPANFRYPFSLPLVYGSDGCADEDEGEDEDECDDGDDNNEDGGNDGDGALPWRHPLRAYRPRPATACKLPLFAYYLLTICLLFAYPICYINSLGSAYLLIQFSF